VSSHCDDFLSRSSDDFSSLRDAFLWRSPLSDDFKSPCDAFLWRSPLSDDFSSLCDAFLCRSPLSDGFSSHCDALLWRSPLSDDLASLRDVEHGDDGVDHFLTRLRGHGGDTELESKSLVCKKECRLIFVRKSPRLHGLL
jgi:hypothetical protein